MRSRAADLLRLSGVLLFLATACLATLAQPTRCDYPEPPDGPGGSVTCEEDQIAVCNMTKAGRVVGECKPRSASARTADQRDSERPPLRQFPPVRSRVARYLSGLTRDTCWPRFWSAGDVQWAVGRETTLREQLRQNPNDYSAHAGLGKALLALGKFVEAEAEFRRAEELLPDAGLAGAASYETGVALYHHGKYAEAEAAFQKAISSRGPNGGMCLRLYLVLTLATQQKYSQAEALLRETSWRPMYEAYILLGYILLDREDFARAEAEFRKVVLMITAPSNNTAHEGLLTALLRQGKFAQADADLGELTRGKNTAWTLFQKGLGLLRQRKYIEAAKEFDFALTIDPTNLTFREGLEVAITEHIQSRQ